MNARRLPFTTITNDIPEYAKQHLRTLNILFSATTECTFIINNVGRCIFASENVASMLGMQQHDFFDKTWQDLGLEGQFLEPFEEQCRKVLATGQTVVAELQYPVVLGMRWFENTVKPIFDASGAIEYMIVSAKDITQQKQREEETARLAAIVASSAEAIIGATLEGVITSWNSSAEKLYGYTADEMLGQTGARLYPLDRLKELAEVLEHIRAGETIEHYESERIKKDGSRIHVLVTSFPIRDRQDRVVGAGAITRDITQEKRMADERTAYSCELEHLTGELRRQRDELITVNSALEEANRGRQFFTAMSHELRTPLASILGFCQLLIAESAEEGRWSQQQRENLLRIQSNGQHLLELINDVLDLVKMEAGRLDITFTQVDMRLLLDSVVEETASLAITRKLVMRSEVEEGAERLETSLLKFRQILLNLVSNALKYTERGEVMILARRADNDHLAISVRDTGIGIPLAEQAHIFDAFYQVNGGYSRKVGGTGLGLAIVNQLTKLLGGKIELSSTQGQGSTFTVILPITTPTRLRPETSQ